MIIKTRDKILQRLLIKNFMGIRMYSEVQIYVFLDSAKTSLKLFM